MKFLKKKATELYVKAQVSMMNLKDDISGSDTTEKVGMIVIAVLIIGALAAVAGPKMKTMFETILGSAQNKLNGFIR